MRDLAKRFGATTALAGMTWTARHGEVTAILGPNGAGKTTTIECAEGLQRPDSGEVLVLGADPWRSGADHRASVGVMLQDGGLPNASTPVRLLRHLAALHQSPADVDALVERLGIDGFSGTTVRRLSGGQKQRVALAAALVGRPQVAFLDEPTAGLDPIAASEFDALIHTLRQAMNLSVFLVTHDLDTLHATCDRIAVLGHGKVLVTGTMAEMAAQDDPWVHSYFHGPRAHAAAAG